MLRFHEAHGAAIGSVLPGFRPNDRQNEGAGVLIEYKLDQLPAVKQSAKQVGMRIENDISASVRACIQRVLGPARVHLDLAEAPLMEMGLSSLELLELRDLLAVSLATELEPTFFFPFGTTEAIVDYVARAAARPPETLQTK